MPLRLQEGKMPLRPNDSFWHFVVLEVRAWRVSGPYSTFPGHKAEAKLLELFTPESTHTPSHVQKSVLFICFICSWFVPFTFILWWKEKFSFRYLLKMHEKLILNKFVFQYVPFFPCPLALILCEKWTYCYTGYNRKILFALYLSAVGCLRACLQSAECLL